MKNMKIIEQEMDQLLNELTFHGSPCTKDCSGHSAGYNYEKRNQFNIRQSTPSNSFNNGTEIATNMRRLGRINAIGSGIRGKGGRFVKFEKNKIQEQITDLDLDSAYEIFRKSYEQETGASWDKNKFLSRARNWTFYGDNTGFVAVRFQRSGLAKLVGAAGNPRGILKGIKELQAENRPIWGMASAQIAAQLEKLGFIRPPAKMLKVIAKIIPKGVFGDVDYTVNADGSLTFNYSDVGAATKYFVANAQYFNTILEQLKTNNHIPVPMFTKIMIAGWIKKVLGMK